LEVERLYLFGRYFLPAGIASVKIGAQFEKKY
jgi:hypothetical protein